MHMRLTPLMFAGTILLGASVSCSGPSPEYGLQHVSPEAVGMDSQKLEKIDSVFNLAVSMKEIPGAVVCVMRNDKIVYEKAFGLKQVEPASDEPMTTGTVFDLASLSKCVSTTVCMMQLVEQGKIRLTDNVKMYIPEFKPWEDPATGEKVDITIQDLLTHTSGIDAYIDDVPGFLLKHPESTPDTLMTYIATECGRNFRPGTSFLYSCLNMITAQNILQKVTGRRLCDYAQENVFDRLGMKDTHYYPIGYEFDAETLANIAPTEVQADGLPYRGQVHDPVANKLNRGNSGNAGVFSNVEDLAIMIAALLNDGEWNGRRVLSPASVHRMLSVPSGYPDGIGRGLGWDFRSSYSSLKGDLMSRTRTFNHTGYTGTSIACDMETGVALIVLTNRAHPHDGGSVARTRAVTANIVAGAVIGE